MQFNSTIAVVFNELNEFSERTATMRKSAKCAILGHTKGKVDNGSSSRTEVALKVLIPYKSFSPYKDLLFNDLLTIERDGVEFQIVTIDTINSASGKIKYFQIELKETPDDGD